jgi:hypothetical protein
VNPALRPRCRGDDGTATSVEMLFLWVVSIALFVFIFELAAYWHVRNVLEQAGAEGARVAALYGGDCSQARQTAIELAARRGGWAKDLIVTCDLRAERAVVRVTASSWSIVFGHASISVATVVGEVPER